MLTPLRLAAALWLAVAATTGGFAVAAHAAPASSCHGDCDHHEKHHDHDKGDGDRHDDSHHDSRRDESRQETQREEHREVHQTNSKEETTGCIGLVTACGNDLRNISVVIDRVLGNTSSSSTSSK